MNLGLSRMATLAFSKEGCISHSPLIDAVASRGKRKAAERAARGAVSFLTRLLRFESLIMDGFMKKRGRGRPCGMPRPCKDNAFMGRIRM